MSEKSMSLQERSWLTLLNAVLSRDRLRGTALKIADKRIYHALVEENPEGCPGRSQEDKYYLVRNLLHTFNQASKDGRIAPSVREAALKVFVGKILLGEDDAEAAFKEQYGYRPPGLLTLSPEERCNLHCIGCYASSSAGDAARLDYDIADRIVREKTELWGSHFTVISGGEPLMWKSQGKDIVDLAAAHPDNYFMMYTNGTLIDEKMAGRMADTGNLTPAISVEGFEAETDARRGKGVHRRILSAFERLRNAGVPFGISITGTRNNADLIVSDPFIDFYFKEQGAIYGWIFQYMPIGREFTLDLMVTPEQRLRMYHGIQRIIRERDVFIADFWNSGPAGDGCIAGGRSAGYLYIDWNGNVSPCVFFPYTTDNILQIYRKGGNINEVLMSPLFKSVRKWQWDYGYDKPADQVGNFLVPCPIRDHHLEAMEWVREAGAQPMDKSAAEALGDEGYHRGLGAYGKKFAALTDHIWEREYIAPERKRKASEKAAA